MEHFFCPRGGDRFREAGVGFKVEGLRFRVYNYTSETLNPPSPHTLGLPQGRRRLRDQITRGPRRLRFCHPMPTQRPNHARTSSVAFLSPYTPGRGSKLGAFVLVLIENGLKEGVLGGRSVGVWGMVGSGAEPNGVTPRASGSTSTSASDSAWREQILRPGSAPRAPCISLRTLLSSLPPLITERWWWVI